jgi:hypothetical protein
MLIRTTASLVVATANKESSVLGLSRQQQTPVASEDRSDDDEVRLWRATIQDVLEEKLDGRKLEEPIIFTWFGKTWPYPFPINEFDFFAGGWSTAGKSHGYCSSAGWPGLSTWVVKAAPGGMFL